MVITRKATTPESEAFRTRHEVLRLKKETRDKTDHLMTHCMWTIAYRAVISSRQPVIIASYSDENLWPLHS